MTISFNHTIVAAQDRQESAWFFTHMFGLPDPIEAGHFLVVELDHGVSFDFIQVEKDTAIARQHYAFLFSEKDFDGIYQRITDLKLDRWADPHQSSTGFNTNDGGRGVYFLDPSGHFLEAITKPYGGRKFKGRLKLQKRRLREMRDPTDAALVPNYPTKGHPKRSDVVLCAWER